MEFDFFHQQLEFAFTFLVEPRYLSQGEFSLCLNFWDGDTVVGRSTGDLGLVSFSRRSLYTEFVGNFT